MSSDRQTDLHPASLGSTPAGTDMSHWWWQEGHPAKIAPRVPVKVLPVVPRYLNRHVRALELGNHQILFFCNTFDFWTIRNDELSPTLTALLPSHT